MPKLTDKIAIISMSCRFPAGANSPELFWENLQNQVDGISAIPANRFNSNRFVSEAQDKSGHSYTDRGGFLDWDPEVFDPIPYNISPREAANLDPQQRLLLDLSRDLFKRAGYHVNQFNGRDIGVFIGGFCVDNLLLKLGPNNWDNINPHTATGATLTMLANRLSHVFNFTGPSYALDTACSSSLVALHQAVQNIQAGECSMALVGGSNVIMSPEYYIAMSKGKFLSEKGRCATFDEEADGYVRGEGAGMLLLKPYDQALEDQDPILAVIAASGVNQDGHTPGITLPSASSQTSLMQKLFEKSGLSPSEVGYVEAHGTGTQAGDQTETSTLKHVFGAHVTKDHPLTIGSVKSNIGHLEAAAGMAGVIKSLLVLQHGQIPANLHLKNRNPKLHWQEGFQVSTVNDLLPLDQERRTILVNSFGYGGTNGMVLLQGVKLSNDNDQQEAKTKKGLLKPFPMATYAADQLASRKENILYTLPRDTDEEAAFLHTYVQGLDPAPYRQLIWYKDQADLREQLSQRTEEDNPEAAIFEPAAAFVYSGMGPHWWGMGRDLYEQEPVYRDAVDEVVALFDKFAGYSLLEAFGSGEENSRIGATEIDQPMGFALQVGLTKLLAARGIKPEAVIGHSLGEVASLWASGLLTLEDAVAVVYHRSRLQARTRGRGGMLATAISEEDAHHLLKTYDQVDIAARNSASMLTLAGATDQLEEIAAELTVRGIFNRYLKVEVAYHSPYMDEIEAELRASLADIKFQTATIPFYSTALGRQFDGDMSVADYWWINIRQAVRFQDGLDALVAGDATHLIEIGPHPVLANPIQENLYHLQQARPYFQTLHRQENELDRLRELTQSLYFAGFDLDWSPWYGQRKVYPFSLPAETGQKLWIESALSKQARFGLPLSPYLFNRLNTPGMVWSADVNNRQFPWLKDHLIRGEAAFPAAGYLDVMLTLARQLLPQDQTLTLKDITFMSLMLVQEDKNLTLFTSYDPATGQLSLNSGLRDQLYQHPRHATATLTKEVLTASVPNVEITEAVEIPPTVFYQLVQELGFEYRDAFQVIKKLQIVDDTLVVDLATEYDVTQNICYPPMLDGVLQAVIGLLIAKSDFQIQAVPYAVEKLSLYKNLGKKHRAVLKLKELSEKRIIVDLSLLNEDGSVSLVAEGFQFVALPAAGKLTSDAFLEAWEKLEIDEDAFEGSTSSREIILESASDLRDDIAAFKTCLFDEILPHVKAGDGSILLLRVEETKSQSPLSDMLVGVLKTLEKEGYGSALRLVFGASKAVSDYQTQWQQSDTFILWVQQDGLYIPVIEAEEMPEISTGLPSPTDQFTFDIAKPENQVTRFWREATAHYEVIEVSKTPTAGFYGGIAHLEGKRYFFLHPKPWQRFMAFEADSLREVPMEFSLASLMMGLQKHAKTLQQEVLLAKVADTDFGAVSFPQEDIQSLLKNALRSFSFSEIDGEKTSLSVPDIFKLTDQSFAISQPFPLKDKAVLITGGTGGFGEKLTYWLYLNGVKRIVLASRSGTLREGKLEDLPPNVEIMKLDVSNATDVETFFEKEAAHETSVSAIFHAAMILQDQTATSLDEPSFEAVMTPKVTGALNLDQASRDLNISHFILFSSIASALGNQGQISYVAANRALENLAKQRVAEGLAGQAIQWGAIADAGVVKRDKQLQQVLTSKGIEPVTSQEALNRLYPELFKASHPVVGIYKYRPIEASDSDVQQSDLFIKLQGLSLVAQQKEIVMLGRDILAKTLKLEIDQVTTNKAISELGVDSLLVVEILLSFEQALGLKVPSTLFMGQFSLEEIAVQICKLIKSE